jgi:PST family polysaccharide transporter
LRDATLLLFELVSLLAWLAAISFYFLSDSIVARLFGPPYQEAAAVLAVSAWAAVFVFSGVVGDHWAIARNLTRQPMIKAVTGAVLNVLLNLVLIPRYGIVGAAAATLISQAVAAVGLNLLLPSMRECFFLQLRAILLPGIHMAAVASLRFERS